VPEPEPIKGLFGLFADWRELLIAWAIAVLGGLARYARMLSDAEVPKMVLAQAFAKLFLAGFTGLLFYWLTADWTMSAHWKALCIAISGHMGAEAIEFIEQTVKDTIRRYAGTSSDSAKP
jgi:hypothetical protein